MSPSSGVDCLLVTPSNSAPPSRTTGTSDGVSDESGKGSPFARALAAAGPTERTTAKSTAKAAVVKEAPKDKAAEASSNEQDANANTAGVGQSNSPVVSNDINPPILVAELNAVQTQAAVQRTIDPNAVTAKTTDKSAVGATEVAAPTAAVIQTNVPAPVLTAKLPTPTETPAPANPDGLGQPVVNSDSPLAIAAKLGTQVIEAKSQPPIPTAPPAPQSDPVSLEQKISADKLATETSAVPTAPTVSAIAQAGKPQPAGMVNVVTEGIIAAPQTQNTILLPQTTAVATGAPTPTAPEVSAVSTTVVRPENAEPSNRNTATQRPAMEPPGGQASAISAIGRAALEEGKADTSPGHGSGGRQAGSTSSSDAEAADRTGNYSSAPASFSNELEGAAPSTPKPLDVEERMRVVEQVQRRIDSIQLNNGRHEVTLRLHPDHLGEVRLTLVADRNQITARIVAETSQARQAMTEGREQLRAALEQKGFSLKSLDVSQLSAKDAEAARTAHAQSMQSLNQGMNFGGERRSGGAMMNQGSNGQAVVRTSASEQAAEPVSAAQEAGPIRRRNGRLDYSA